MIIIILALGNEPGGPWDRVWSDKSPFYQVWDDFNASDFSAFSRLFCRKLAKRTLFKNLQTLYQDSLQVVKGTVSKGLPCGTLKSSDIKILNPYSDHMITRAGKNMIERVRNSPFLRCSLLSPFSSKLPGNHSASILTFNPFAVAATFLMQISEISIFQLLSLNRILQDLT